jgi:hypothetical protein
MRFPDSSIILGLSPLYGVLRLGDGTREGSAARLVEDHSNFAHPVVASIVLPESVMNISPPSSAITRSPGDALKAYLLLHSVNNHHDVRAIQARDDNSLCPKTLGYGHLLPIDHQSTRQTESVPESCTIRAHSD